MGESDNILYADDFCIIRSHTEGKIGIQTGREPETETPTVVSVDDILPALTQLTTNMDLHDAIHERLVVDEPDHEQLLAAVEGAVEIVRGRYRVLTTDAIHERPPVDRVLTYLLGRYCAERLSDGAVSAQTDRADLRAGRRDPRRVAPGPAGPDGRRRRGGAGAAAVGGRGGADAADGVRAVRERRSVLLLFFHLG